MKLINFTPLEIKGNKSGKAKFLTRFTKMVASGNDFVIVEDRLHSKISQPKILAKKICHRRYGVGAYGLLILKKSKLADIKMRIFNPDGSEAEMCGNGARCVSLWLKSKIMILYSQAQTKCS